MADDALRRTGSTSSNISVFSRASTTSLSQSSRSRRERHQERDKHALSVIDTGMSDITRTTTLSPVSARSTTSSASVLNASEIKRVLDKLKSELDNERMKNKHQTRERAKEIKKLKAWFERERETTSQNVRDAVCKEKDEELHKLLNYKEEELQQMRAQFKKDREEAVHVALENQKKVLRQNSDSGSSELIMRLQREIKSLKFSYRELEERKKTEDRTSSKDHSTTNLELSSSERNINRMLHGVQVELSRSLELMQDANTEISQDFGSPSLRQNSLKVDKLLIVLQELSKQLSTIISSREKSEEHLRLLENNVNQLTTDNANLRRRIDGPAANDERVRKLKRRNAELAAIARRLEEKAKRVQNLEERGAPVGSENAPNLDEIRREYERKKARDLADHAKNILEKDKELEVIQRNYMNLEHKSKVQGAEREGLESMLRSAQRERLMLEKQLSMGKNLFSDPPARERIDRLQQEISTIEESRYKLEEELRELRIRALRVEFLESSVLAGEKEKETLAADLQVERNEKDELEANEVDTEANSENQDPDAVMEDIIKQHMRASELKKRDLELDRMRIQDLLERKQFQTPSFGIKDKEKPKFDSSEESVESMRARLREIQKKCELQELQHEELLLELESVRKKQKYEELREMGMTLTAAEAEPEDERPLPATDNGTTPRTEALNRVTNRNLPVEEPEMRVFIAKYNYDPYQYSPNDNPDDELSLTAGDYIIVHGEMDEDGFYMGEMVDGKRGLVPSNFIEAISKGELNQAQNSKSGLFAERVSLVRGPGSDLETHVVLHPPPPPLLTSDDRSLSSLEEEENVHVPPPRRLTLDRQLASSALISWSHCEVTEAAEAEDPVQAYHVYLDGQFKCAVKSNDRTKALLEGIDFGRSNRISVRSVTARGHSREAECTLRIGSEASLAPSELKITRIGPTSAKLSWMPANSNMGHSVSVNTREVEQCAPSVCKVMLRGLRPNTIQKVTVRALRSRLEGPPADAAAGVRGTVATAEFRTLEQNCPDPPTDVQAEPGPQNGTLLITWVAPASSQTVGSRPPPPPALRATGYVVMADGNRRLLEVSGQNTDHALVTLEQLTAQVSYITVRALAAAVGTESEDSSPPCSLLEEWLQIPTKGGRGATEDLSDIQEEDITGTAADGEQEENEEGEEEKDEVEEESPKEEGEGEEELDEDAMAAYEAEAEAARLEEEQARLEEEEAAKRLAEEKEAKRLVEEEEAKRLAEEEEEAKRIAEEEEARRLEEEEEAKRLAEEEEAKRLAEEEEARRLAEEEEAARKQAEEEEEKAAAEAEAARLAEEEVKRLAEEEEAKRLAEEEEEAKRLAEEEEAKRLAEEEEAKRLAEEEEAKRKEEEAAAAAAAAAAEGGEGGEQGEKEDDSFFGKIKKAAKEAGEKMEQMADEAGNNMKEFSESTNKKLADFNEENKRKLAESLANTQKALNIPE